METLITLQAETPCGLNHIVLNVRDLDRAHAFWTACLGFRHVGTWQRPGPEGAPLARMRFYSGEKQGKLRHHDVALLEQPSLPSELPRHLQVLNHVAVTYATREAWQRQIRFLISKGMTPDRQLERGAIYSAHLHDPDGNEIELVCEWQREIWENDTDAAINHAVALPVGS